MLMTDMRDYLQLVGRASLQDLARHFKIKESAVQQMLSFWVRKGQIGIIDATQNSCSAGKCSDCFECDDGAKQIYIWVS